MGGYESAAGSGSLTFRSKTLFWARLHHPRPRGTLLQEA